MGRLSYVNDCDAGELSFLTIMEQWPHNEDGHTSLIMFRGT
jgi:hypothetical protein